MWKTTTIVTILLLSILLIGMIYYNYNQEIIALEEGINKEVSIRLEEKEKQYQLINENKIKNLKSQNDSLSKLVLELKNDLELALTGGAEIKKRKEIMKNASMKLTKSLKLKKGEIYRDQTTNLVAYVRPDYYDDRIIVNLTHKDKDTFEEEWFPGRYYYYMEEEEGLLSEIIILRLNKDEIKVDWTSYKL